MSKILLKKMINKTYRKRKNMSISKNNLASKLNKVNVGSDGSDVSDSSDGSMVYGKTITSSFSSVLHNGKLDTKGTKIQDDISKPYVEVDGFDNEEQYHYTISKKHLTMEKPLKLGKKKLKTKHRKTKKTKKAKKH